MEVAVNRRPHRRIQSGHHAMHLPERSTDLIGQRPMTRKHHHPSGNPKRALFVLVQQHHIGLQLLPHLHRPTGQRFGLPSGGEGDKLTPALLRGVGEDRVVLRGVAQPPGPLGP